MTKHEDNIFAQLKSEHRELEKLLDKCENASGRERKSLLEAIEANIVPHARAEEKTLYAALYKDMKQKDEPDQALINEAYAEHAAVDKLLHELKGLSPDDEAWLGKLTVIKENVKHHIEEEEKDLFELADKQLGDTEKEQIFKHYKSVKEEFEQTLPTQGQIAEREPVKPLQENHG